MDMKAIRNEATYRATLARVSLLMDLDPAFKAKIIEEQLVFMRASLEQAEDEDGSGGRKSPRIKQIEKQIENLEQKLEASLSGVGKDKNVRFDEL